MMITCPPAVSWIVSTLEAKGFETWAVGGAVRNSLLGIQPGDWDLATRATPSEVRKLFRRTVPVGIEHGTVGVLDRAGVMYEVTTFRRDVSTDGRRAVVSFAETVEEDLTRRDFTINAIAWHPERDELLDPHQGARDLERRVLRTVGSPTERFQEDYLRILRALRFAGLFGLEIEPESWQAVLDSSDGLRQLSVERVREELMKVLGSDSTPSRTLGLYSESGAIAKLYPELLPTLEGRTLHGSAWERTTCMTDRLRPSRPFLRLAALLSPIDSTRAVVGLLLRLKFSKAQTEMVSHLTTVYRTPRPDSADGAEVRLWVSRVGRSYLAGLARLLITESRCDGVTDVRALNLIRAARSVAQSGDPLELSDLAIDGRTLISLGMKPGKHFKTILDGLMAAVIRDPTLNDADTLIAKVRADFASDASSDETKTFPPTPESSIDG